MLGRQEKVPEFKEIARRLVRAADESSGDHQATVAYVSRAAHDQLAAILDSRKNSKRPRLLKKDLTDTSMCSHEHATPVELVLRTITLSENQAVPIFDMLKALSCRVLIAGFEKKRIDNKLKWTVPATLQWSESISFGVRTLKPDLLPLIRYYDIDPAISLSLLPVQVDRKATVDQFRSLMTAKTPTELTLILKKCQRTATTAFGLSDQIYRSASTRIKQTKGLML